MTALSCRSLLLSSELKLPCFHALAHSFGKNTGGGGGRAKVHGKWSFRGKEVEAKSPARGVPHPRNPGRNSGSFTGKKVEMLPTGDNAKPFGITSLCDPAKQLP